jgi:hypothetical protein
LFGQLARHLNQLANEVEHAMNAEKASQRPSFAASFIPEPHTRRQRLQVVFREPCRRSVSRSEDFDMVGIANLFAGVDVNKNSHEEETPSLSA